MHAGGGVADGPSNYFDAKDPFEVIIFIFMFALTIFSVNIQISNYKYYSLYLNHLTI